MSRVILGTTVAIDISGNQNQLLLPACHTLEPNKRQTFKGFWIVPNLQIICKNVGKKKFTKQSGVSDILSAYMQVFATLSSRVKLSEQSPGAWVPKYWGEGQRPY